MKRYTEWQVLARIGGGARRGCTPISAQEHRPGPGWHPRPGANSSPEHLGAQSARNFHCLSGSSHNSTAVEDRQVIPHKEGGSPGGFCLRLQAPSAPKRDRQALRACCSEKATTPYWRGQDSIPAPRHRGLPLRKVCEISCSWRRLGGVWCVPVFHRDWCWV